MADLITLAQVRSQGLTVAQAPDAQVNAAISLASAYLQDEVGMSYYPVPYPAGDPVPVDGTGHETLWLMQPIISVTELGEYHRGVAGDTKTVIPAYRYEVYNSRARGDDDRSNPKIVLLESDSTIWSSWFTEGRRNYYLVGSFGWTDLIGGTEQAPLDVQRAVLTLVIMDYAWLLANDTRPSTIDEPLRRFMLSETTEGHNYRLADTAASGGSSGIRSVDRLIARYRALRPHYVGT